MGQLEGGSTIGGYTAVHTGLKVVGFTGKVAIGQGNVWTSNILTVHGTGDVWHASIGDQAAGVIRFGGNTGSGAVIQSKNQVTDAARDLYLQRDGGNIVIGGTSASYKLDVKGDIIADSWIRTRNSTGLYNETYGGGWHMTDSTWVRSYASTAGAAKGILIEKNTATISNSSYDNGHIELKTTDASASILGFHRSGYTGIALYHDGVVDPLKVRDNTGNVYNVGMAGRKTATQLNDTTNLASGIYSNSGDGLFNPDGTTKLNSDTNAWYHVYHSRHLDGNGYAAQIAICFSSNSTGNLGLMFSRYANGTTWGSWTPIGGSAGGGGSMPPVGKERIYTGPSSLAPADGTWKTILDVNGVNGRLDFALLKYAWVQQVPYASVSTRYVAPTGNLKITLDGISETFTTVGTGYYWSSKSSSGSSNSVGNTLAFVRNYGTTINGYTPTSAPVEWATSCKIEIMVSGGNNIDARPNIDLTGTSIIYRAKHGY